MLMVVQVVISINMYRALLKLTADEEVQVSILFEFEPKKIVNYSLTSVVVGFLVVIGMIALIIPGIYWSLVFSQALILVADKGVGVGGAMRGSRAMMKGYKIKYLLLGLALMAVNFLGLLALLVGVVVTAIISQFALVLFYKKLLVRLDGEAGGQDQVGVGIQTTQEAPAAAVPPVMATVTPVVAAAPAAVATQAVAAPPVMPMESDQVGGQPQEQAGSSVETVPVGPMPTPSGEQQ